MPDNRSLSDLLAARFPPAVIGSHNYRDDATVTIHPEFLLQVAKLIKEDSAFQMNFLMDLTAVDYLNFGKGPEPVSYNNTGIPVRPNPQIPDEAPWPGRALRPGSGQALPARFEVVYHFFSLPMKQRLRVKVPVEESRLEVDSLTSLWESANWFEREIWDMFGIRFRGHQNLKRILMYKEFTGHPLRKDYPVNKRQPLIGPMN